MRRHAISSSAFLFRVFSVFSVCSVGYLVGKNHGIHGKHGTKLNKNEPFFNVNHRSIQMKNFR
jgi:hypothetical protein